MNFRLKPAAKKAIAIGGLCSVAYLAVYVAKNILSAATPQITAAGAFTVERIGALSSTYYICYAIGQLINGYIGDKIKAKYMISFGLMLASVGFWLLPQLSGLDVAATIAYGASGFFMAMIYGPMTKVVAENTEPLYATRCSMGYTLASFLGSPAAGVLAASLAWEWAFRASGGIMVVMATICLIVFTAMERKGLVRYNQYKPKEKGVGNLKILLKRQILRFAMIAVLTGVIRTAVLFWLPTYISQYLNFDPSTAALVYTVGTLLVSSSTFLAIFAYEKVFRQNMDLTILVSFAASAASFAGAFLVPVTMPVVNIAFMVLAILTANCASNMIWSRYCPSLFDTGMVSGATGFLDCCSYLAASAATVLFANAVADIGWGKLILVWMGLMVVGIAFSLPFKRKGATAVVPVEKTE